MRLASFLLFLCSILICQAYRLNVPRVLLPYHPNVPVSFVLEVTHPSGGCFHWRSTRPNIVSVKSLEPNQNGCSDRAEIRSVAKPGGVGSSELSSVIFAEDKTSGTTLSCGVTVDEIATISIETTTKVLFVDAAPARMTVDAFNADGDRFSTLSEIALEWELTSTSPNGEKPLRIVPFEQSTYEAPIEIVKLEKNRKKGYLILIEGVGTGTARLSTKFSDVYLQKVKSHNVELAVVANLLLVPSQDIYLPVQSVLPFQVLIVKQRGTEVVDMPSPSYELQVDSNEIIKLDSATSTIRAIAKGNSAIHLLSNHVDARAKAGLRPPSTPIHVVDPESVQWHVSGENWMLETGKEYELNVELFDEHGNVMFISNNLKFSTKIDETLLRVNFISENGTYVRVTPLKPAKTTVSTKFVAILDENGQELRQTGRIYGEQKLEIVDPVRIVPPVIYLPLATAEKRSTIELTATGGSGIVEWRTGNDQVATIDGASGKLTANKIGSTFVRVEDKRNALLTDEAQLYVIDVNEIGFGETKRETFVGQNLDLNIQLFGLSPNDGSQILITECRNVQIRVESQNSNILRHVPGAPSMLPTEGSGCGTITLKGVASGDTRVTVYHNEHKATIEVSVYEKMRISSDDVAIGINSDIGLELAGGPRQWMLESSTFYRKDSNVANIKVNFDNDKIIFRCENNEASETVKIRVGNHKSTTLPLPIHSEVDVVVCCAKPAKLDIIESEARPAKCPANVHALLVNSESRLLLQGYGVCAGRNRQLQSINGLKTKWSSSDNSVLKIVKSGIENTNNWAEVSTKNQGTSIVTAEIVSRSTNFIAKYEIQVTGGLSIEPSRLVLWNEAVSKGKFVVNGGSGHFLVDDRHIAAASPVSLSIRGRSLMVTPKNHGQATLKIVDACVGGQAVDATVRIAEIASLAIEGPKFVEIGQEVEVEIVALDETGATFEKEHRPLADSQLDVSNSHVSIKKIDGLKYLLKAESIGSVSLSATSKSTSSGRVLSSRPKIVQIFSPIYLQPKRLTLIPESKFQLEVIGGPQPTPPLDFALNNSKIASIEPNALITSKETLGYTSIVGTVRVGDGHVTKDQVILRVVSLGGVVITASSRLVEAGGRVNLRLRGIVGGSFSGDDEEPFTFGGAQYPLKVTWSVSDPTILHSTHPLGGDVVESSDNQFAIWFDALRSGSVTIKAIVELNPSANHHFVGSATSFTAETTITVENGLSLTQPVMEKVSTIRVAPNSQLKLITAWSHASFSVPNEYSSRITVTNDGILNSYGREGSAAVAVQNTDSADNETVLIPVTVARVYSLDVYPTIELKSAVKAAPLTHLPVGAQIQLNIVARDAKGRELASSTVTKINYRPHRFDLTDIVASNNNRTLKITLKSSGDTVLRIGDATNQHISTFVRLSAAESILPRAALKYSNDLVVSDVMCLQSSIISTQNDERTSIKRWSSKSSGDGRIRWFDETLGVGQLFQAGETFIKFHADAQTIHSKIAIAEPHALRFTTLLKPHFVTNEDEAKFVFAVTAVSNSTTENKLTSIYGDCTPEQMESLERQDSTTVAPFECQISFVKRSKTYPAVNWLKANAVFRKNVGYACEVQKFDASLIGSGIQVPEEMEKEQFAIQLIAKWTSEAATLATINVQEAKTLVPFHFAIHVEEKELVFSNMDQSGSALSIWSPKYDFKHVVVKGCEGDIVSIEKLYASTEKHSAKGNIFYNVKLNIKSAALFSEHARKCRVKVENTVTGQIIEVPVTIQLLDETAKQVYNALESRGFLDVLLILSKKYSNLIPTLLWTCGVGIILLLAGIYVKMNVWDKSGSFGDTTMNQSIHQTSIASSLSSTANSSGMFKDSPIFRSTPIAGSPNVNIYSGRDYRHRNIGSSGDGRLWSTKH